MFRTVTMYTIRSFSLYTQQWCISYGFAKLFETCRVLFQK